MNSLMEYKGYHAKIEYSAEDNALVGRIVGINDYIIFDGKNINELTKMFHQSIDEYLADCKASGKEPDKEYKGSFNVRLGTERHKQAMLMAEAEGITLNQLVCQAVESYCAEKK